MKVGKSIQEIRKDNGLSQEEFGKMFHVTRQTVSNWENEKSYPDLETLIAISDKFGISLDKLLKEDKQMVQKIDSSRKQVKGIVLLFAGFLPFVTGWFLDCWILYTPFPVWGNWGNLLWLFLWGYVCYKVSSPDRNLYLQIGILNLGGILAFIETNLCSYEIIEPLRLGRIHLNGYLKHALGYPFKLYLIPFNRGIVLPFILVNIAAWLIMVSIATVAVVLKVKGFRFKNIFSKDKN